ncbi:amidase [Ramlibacter sp. AW1]|uniref:Amidase n=1 Tax=Ramlibacter aurantiacus TaxID=2801330 RepID=A0A937D348_9BURK|nr:amidase [Ramlibacter aurantiacus]MBL0420365.1 amidase [Ramlibacter aurantiacus]
MTADLTRTLEAIRSGRTHAAEELEKALAIAASPRCRPAFLKLFDGQARAEAATGTSRTGPLAGLPISVKDLFDLNGQPTTAGSRVLHDAPAATRDALAVQRLRAAGATVIGRTHMTEFAFSGVGTNPHFPVPANPADPSVDRIPGGSSSGAAVSVASGAAFIGLGSDTGGSIRIPAALCGIVGFKNTARLTPTEGALPLSTTLDTACAMTRSVADAVLAHEILSGTRVARQPRPISSLRLAVPTNQLLDGMDAQVTGAFERTLRLLRAAGARIEEITVPPLDRVAGLQAGGGFTAAESYAWHRHLLERRGNDYDPRVRLRIERGAAMKAWEYLDLMHARQAWIAEMEAAAHGFDALLSPTVPIVAPTIASLAPADGIDAAIDAARDETFFRTNALLLRNPSVVNQLDGCAISIPCHAPGELPAGLMVWHGALRDEAVLNIAGAIEVVLRTGAE